MDSTTLPAPTRKRNSRAGKPPAFSFFAADWLADKEVRKMSLAERGIFIDLLAYSWREHGLDSDPEEIRRLLNLRRGQLWNRAWQRIAPRFSSDHACGCGENHFGRLFNERLEKERRAQVEYAAKQRDRAGMRWHQFGIDSAMPRECRIDALQSASAFAGGGAEVPGRDGDLSQTETLPPPGGDERARHLAALARWRVEFDSLWKAHPYRRREESAKGVKANKPVAWETYRALRPSLALAAEIAAGHARAVASDEWQRGVVPDLHRWLRAKRWNDEHGAGGTSWKEQFLAKGTTDGD